MNESQADIRWFTAWASRNNLPKPVSAEMEAFAERVAIKMADAPEGMSEAAIVGAARYQAAREWEWQLRLSGAIYD